MVTTTGLVTFRKEGQEGDRLPIIDHFSKNAEVIAIAGHPCSEDVWTAFVYRWIQNWGVPIRLHPQGNGVIEAFHQFLERSLSAQMTQSSAPFQEVLACVLIAYRSSPHPSTGEAPFYLMTGLDFMLPGFQDWAQLLSEKVELGPNPTGYMELTETTVFSPSTRLGIPIRRDKYPQATYIKYLEHSHRMQSSKHSMS